MTKYIPNDNIFQKRYPTINCRICNDIKWIITDQGAKRCSCIMDRIKKKILGNQFYSCSLTTLIPQFNISLQQKALEIVRKAPQDSYFFTGNYRCGKTHFLSAQYNYLLEKGIPNLIYIRETDLIEGIEKSIKTKDFDPPINIDNVSNLDYFHLFIDDLGVTDIPSWIGQRIFRLIDTIYRENFRLSASSTLQLPDLIEIWSKYSNAGGTVRRIEDICSIIML